MPDSAPRYESLPLARIQVNRAKRQRRKIDTSNLQESMAKVGQLQPIIVEMQACLVCQGLDSTCPTCWGNGQLPTLISGERRLTSAQNLGWDTISVRWIHELSPRERQIIELEENIRRADLPWQDIVAAVKRIHDLFVESDPAWTQAQTAEALGLDRSAVTHYLLVASSLDDSRVQLASTIMEAANIVRRRNERRAGEALEEFLGVGGSGDDSHDPSSDLPNNSSGDSDPGSVRVEPDSILAADFLQWAPAYSGRRFNFIHCDFPYGIDHGTAPQSRRSEPSLYPDSEETYFSLLQCLCDNLPRLMSVSGHIMFWYSDRHRDRTLEIFRASAPQLKFTTFPLVWLKSDNVGISADPRRLPRHIYETCLLASRGDQPLIQLVSDAYSCPTDKTLHASTKPEPMLRHFMTMLVDENTRLLDPTAGSGAALRSAESLGASHVLGLEIDSQVSAQSNAYLRKWRAMRRLG